MNLSPMVNGEFVLFRIVESWSGDAVDSAAWVPHGSLGDLDQPKGRWKCRQSDGRYRSPSNHNPARSVEADWSVGEK